MPVWVWVFLGLSALGLAGCGGGGAETGVTTRPPRLSYGPAKSHPYWWASEVLLKEVEEVRSRFEGLRPDNLRAKLNLMAQVERLQRGCEDGYGVAECRRSGEIYRIAASMWRAIVPPRRRHVGFSMALQIAWLRFHQRQDEDGPRSFSAQIAGLHVLALAMRAHLVCKATPTCPWERSARVEAMLRRELSSPKQPVSLRSSSARPPRYRPGDADCRTHQEPGTVGAIGEDLSGVRVEDFVACYGPPLRKSVTPVGRCLFYRQRGAPTYWRLCVRNGRIVSALGSLSRLR
jgi:hypothetical protein